MISYIAGAVAVLATFALLDFVWLALIQRKTWENHVEKIQGSPIKYKPVYAVAAYSVMLIGILTLAMPRVRQDHIIMDSLIYGGVTGFVMYGVFNTVNAAIFSDYDPVIGIVDLLWGVFICAVATTAGSYASIINKHSV